MSSEVISHALALYLKAEELESKGHLLRAAEYFGRAAEAARSLDPSEENCATLGIQCCQAAMLGTYCADALNSKSVDPGQLAAHRAASVALLAGITAVLERRCVAGTLLEGKCTAAEEAWMATTSLREIPPAEAASVRKLVGYHTLIFTAVHVFDVQLYAFAFAGECSATQFESFAQFVVHAMDLMQQMCPGHVHPLAMEATFAISLSKNVTRLASRGLDPHLAQLLTDAWLRLLQSGVLQQRGLLDERLIRSMCARSNSFAETVKSALSAPGLRRCGLASCGAREAHPQHFKSCASCRRVVYCCREHQVADWPAHKAACKAARKTPAASDKGADASR